MITSTRAGATYLRGQALLIGILSLCGCASAPTPKVRPQPADSVNTGYVKQARHDVTGAIASYDAGGAVRNPTSIAELIAVRFPGVEVLNAPKGELSVRIRGAHTLGNSEPLFVVDGVTLSSGVGSKLADIDPADVKRIDVLKDASETAIYGAHGANGVIVITLNHRK